MRNASTRCSDPPAPLVLGPTVLPTARPAAGAPFARKFMCEEQYYREDQAHPPLFDLRRLGRRFQEDGMSARTHSVSRCIGRTASGASICRGLRIPTIRGVWKGLAPMRSSSGASRALPWCAFVRVCRVVETAGSASQSVPHLLSLSHRLGRWHRGAGGGRGCLCECSWRGGSAAARSRHSWARGIPLPLDRLLRDCMK